MTKQEAKRQLFHMLLKIPADKVTETEADMMFALARDRDIQEILERKLKEEEKE